MSILEDDFKSTNEYREKEGGLDPLPWSEPGIEPPSHSERWSRRGIDRELYFSKRLEQLFKRLKVKSQLVAYVEYDDLQPTGEDEKWIQEKLARLAKKGLAEAPKAAQPKDVAASRRWFSNYLRKNGVKKPKKIDFTAIEKKHKVTLPQDYKDFITAVGPKSFSDVCGLEGSKIKVLTSQKLDFKDYRRGKVRHLQGEQAEVDGVMFAEMDNGDCFVFDVTAKAKDYPTYWYKHEENDLQAFAPTFAECIRRFAEKT